MLVKIYFLICIYMYVILKCIVRIDWFVETLPDFGVDDVNVEGFGVDNGWFIQCHGMFYKS